MSEYLNTYVMRDGKAYRVAFHVGLRKPMIVCRRTKHGETVLNLFGPTGAAVIKAARLQLP